MTEPIKYEPGVNFVKVFVCHGCQTCWRYDENDEPINTGPHFLSVENTTQDIKQLYAKANVECPTY